MFILFAGGSVVVETLSGFNRVVLKVVLSTIVSLCSLSQANNKNITALFMYMFKLLYICIITILSQFPNHLASFCSSESCYHLVFIKYRILYIFSYILDLRVVKVCCIT